MTKRKEDYYCPRCGGLLQHAGYIKPRGGRKIELDLCRRCGFRTTSKCEDYTAEATTQRWRAKRREEQGVKRKRLHRVSEFLYRKFVESNPLPTSEKWTLKTATKPTQKKFRKMANELIKLFEGLNV